MKIKYLGQSCFCIQSESGVRIVTDPFHSDIGLKMPKIVADIVTTSHDHFDHNNVGKIQGEYDRYSAPGYYEKSGVAVSGFASYHDDVKGCKRGPNVIFCFDIEGLRLCHLGDLGHVPDDKLLTQIGAVDVLFIPVGEVFTFGVSDAYKTVTLMKPKIVIPMHYKTHKLTIGLETEQKFLKIAGDSKKLDTQELTLTPETLSTYAGILVMEPQA